MITITKQTSKFKDEYVLMVTGTYKNSEKTFSREIGGLCTSTCEDLYLTYMAAAAAKDKDFTNFSNSMDETFGVHEFLERDYNDNNILFESITNIEIKYFDEQGLSYDVSVTND